MTCTLNIAAYLFGKPLEYRYVVYSPRMKCKEDDCFEYLHYFSCDSQDPNRYMRISSASPHGMFKDIY